ncbi:MAG: SIR2 family protein [Verrucomicrobiales bacterium]|nr:SIR2 family protein [Verrucomicrobiales bacterium]
MLSKPARERYAPQTQLGFIKSIVSELRAGWGVTPFTGAGVSARSGIITGLQFVDYLTWTIFRSVASARDLEACLGSGAVRWNVQLDGWPRIPKPSEVDTTREWVFREFALLCRQHGLKAIRDDQSATLVLARLIPEDADSSPQPEFTAANLDTHLRRPLVPAILRSWPQTNVDDVGLKQLLRLFHAEDEARGVLTRVGFSPESEEAVVEQAIRSLHDWRGMLEFLARLRIRRPSGKRKEGGSLDERAIGTTFVGERDPSVIDRFNTHITVGRKPNLTHSMISHLSGPFRARMVLTTNFDDLQEQAFQQLDLYYREIPVSNKGELPSADTVHSMNCIVKLHGSLIETRADFSLDEIPLQPDKEKFFDYVRGRSPAAEGHKSGEEGFLPTHLLVCGYSGNDARCISMIKYVLDRSPDSKLFWVCYNRNDLERLGSLFPEEAYWNGPRQRIFATITDRSDLLFLELYQEITLSLPKGGFSYHYSHDVPPELWDPSQGATKGSGHAKEVNNIVSRVVARTKEVEDHLRQSSDKKSINPKSRAQSAKWLPFCIEACPTDPNSAANRGTGLTGILKDALTELAHRKYSSIWLEMEDFADAESLLHNLLQVISLRLGRFQLEHAVLLPIRLKQMVTEPQNDWDGPTIAAWQGIVQKSVNYLGIQPERFAICLYGRNVPGMCAGWDGSPWTEKSYRTFHCIITALSRLGFVIIYAPLTRQRVDSWKEKAAELNRTADALRRLALEKRGRFLRMKTPPSMSHKPEAENIEPRADWADLSIERDKQRIIPDRMEVIRCKPTQTENPILKTLDAVVTDRLWKAYMHSGTHGDEDWGGIVDEMRFLYMSTLYRRSRPHNVFTTEPVMPSPFARSSCGLDNDWVRKRDAEAYLEVYRDRGLLWRKPGGNHWYYRDGRLGVRHLLESAAGLPSGDPNGSDRVTDWPAQLEARGHYWAAKWYFRAYCTTFHAVPMCEAYYHLFQSIKAVPIARRPSSPMTPEEDSPESITRYRRFLFVRALTELVKLVKLGRTSLLFWLDRPAAEAWFNEEAIAQTLGKISQVHEDLYGATSSGSQPLKDAKFASAEHGLALVRELADELTISRHSFARELALPSSPLLAACQLQGNQEGASVSELEIEKPELFAEATTSQKAKDWRRNFKLKAPAKNPSARLLNETLESVVSTLIKKPDNIYVSLRKSIHGKLSEAGVCELLPPLISALDKLAYQHVRRAKILDFVQTLKLSEKPEDHTIFLIPSSLAGREVWKELTILTRIISDLCDLCPPSLIEFERSLRSEGLCLLALALARLGRFHQAYRRLNEAEALLSKLPRKQEGGEIAIIELRRGEVHLQQALMIQNLRCLGKLEPRQQTKATRNEDQGLMRALTYWQTPRGARSDAKAKTLADQWSEQYGPWEELQGIQGERLLTAKLDDCWASLENAEKLLSGKIRTTQWWGRLCTLKLRLFASLPREEDLHYRPLAWRKNVERPEELLRIVELGRAVWPDDPFRRLRLAFYFSKACVRSDGGRMLRENPAASDVLMEKFELVGGYEVGKMPLLKNCIDGLAKFREQLRKRKTVRPLRKSRRR